MTRDDFHSEIHGGSDGLWYEFGPKQDGPPDDREQAVWVSPGSPCYHQLGCRWLGRDPLLASRVKAENAGFRPCPNCRP